MVTFCLFRFGESLSTSWSDGDGLDLEDIVIGCDFMPEAGYLKWPLFPEDVRLVDCKG